MSTQLEDLGQKLEAAMATHEQRDAQSDKIISRATAISAGLGFAPMLISDGPFMLVNIGMVIMLGKIHGNILTKSAAAKLILKIFMTVGMTQMALVFAGRMASTFMRGVSLVTFGVGWLPAMAIDGAMLGGATFALGHVTKEYFQCDGKMSPQQLKATYQRYRAQGQNQSQPTSQQTTQS